jgi:hypothetical protein
MRRLRRDSSGRLLAGLAVTVGLLLPLAVFGAPALARTAASASEYEYGGSGHHQYSGSAQYQYRIQVCHMTGSRKHPGHTIWVSSRAWPAHSRHGDHLGSCTGSEQRLTKHGHGKGNKASSDVKGTSHGKSNGKGKGNGEGHGNKQGGGD